MNVSNTDCLLKVVPVALGASSSADEDSSDSLSDPVAKKRDMAKAVHTGSETNTCLTSANKSANTPHTNSSLHARVAAVETMTYQIRCIHFNLAFILQSNVMHETSTHTIGPIRIEDSAAL